jgi:hypothetical protein
MVCRDDCANGASLPRFVGTIAPTAQVSPDLPGRLRRRRKSPPGLHGTIAPTAQVSHDLSGRLSANSSHDFVLKSLQTFDETAIIVL